jgi:hypothetical protein
MIWMGKNIPGDYVNNIRSFVAYNPDYQVNLWLENPARFLQTHSRMDAATFKVHYRKISDVVAFMDPRMRNYFEREKTGVYPNYAAASDILRLFILLREGGIYVDTDVRAKANQSFGDIDAKYGFLFNVKVKDPYCDPTESPVYFNNNILLASPGSPYVAQIIDEMILRHQEADPEILWQSKRAPGAPDVDPHLSDRFFHTIRLTGPVLMEDIFYRNFLDPNFDSLTKDRQIYLFSNLAEKIYSGNIPSFVSDMNAPLSAIEDKNDNSWCIKKENKGRPPAEY